MNADILRRRIELMVNYLDMRTKMKDWHGVRDAAADIEQLEAQLAVLNELNPPRSKKP